MAIFAFTGATVWVGAADVSARTNDITVDATIKDLDATTFVNSGWETHVGGLGSAKFDLKGFWDADSTGQLPDDLFFGEIGTGGIPITVTPQGATVGNVAYLSTVMQPSYKFGAKVGDLLTFETSKIADAKLVRGQVANVTAKTSTGTTTGLNLTAPTATQRVHCSVHVLTVSGTGSPTLTVAVQGDTSNAFAAPSTIVTGSAITAVGSQYLKGAVGVTSNTWYRLSLTISGSSPSFLLYAAIGVG